MQIDYDVKLDFNDVLILPKVSNLGSRSQVSLVREFSWIDKTGEEHTVSCVPLIASNMDGVGTFEMNAALSKQRCLTALVKHYTLEDWIEFYQSLKTVDMNSSIMSIGMTESDLELASRVVNSLGVDKVCIDVANGYNINFERFVEKAREELPAHTFIIAGNVVTGSQTERLLLAGANAVKVGIGSGSVCTTRKVTGVGMPQLSAIIECADAAHGMGGFVVSDGGCQTAGDVCKAYAAGADFVMLGGMLAAHDEGYPEVKDLGQFSKLPFFGSSSKTAQEKHNGGLAEYRSSEGKQVLINPRGPVDATLNHILGGVRSCCTYVGARSLKELSKRTTFIRVNNQYNTMFGDAKEVS